MSRFDELAHDVAEFSITTFGSQGSSACAIKCSNEADEFLESQTIDEAADVLITLLSWCGQTGHGAAQLLTAAEAKMHRNRLRRWVLQPDGTYQHAPEGL